MTTLYMLASQSHVQMMSFILKSDDRLVVIDGGNTCDADYLCTYVKKLGGVIDGWFLTHAHSDHINAMTSLLERHADEVKIGGIYMNFPSDEFLNSADKNVLPGVIKLRNEIERNKLSVTIVKKGDVFNFGEMTIRVLLEPDESITENAVNNSSVVYRLDVNSGNKKGPSVIFLGDLGVEGGHRLLESNPPELIKADYVQMAHHGQQGVDRSVYDAIDPDYCLWCTPDWLWDNNAGRGYDTHIWKTIVTRGWMSDIGIKWHYISKDGTQEVPLGEE
jgi:beta-lactamase superfamily II metal-dependent hydrolase